MDGSGRAERSSLLVSLEHHKHFMIMMKILFAVSILYERVLGKPFLLVFVVVFVLYCSPGST